MNLLDRRFDEAFELAVSSHRLQPRSGTSIPHLGHLLSVASMVIDDGGDTDQAIGGLLHDIDVLGDAAVADVGSRFGSRVRRIVIAVGGGRPPTPAAWRSVKADHVAGMATSPLESWRVSLADSLSEARYVLSDLRQHGPLAFDAEQGRALQWYHRSLAATYAGLVPGPMLDDYARVVAEIESIAW